VSPRAQTDRSRRGGFTLVELIAVMTIMAILVLAVVPSLDGLVPKYRLRAGARNVAANIEHAQSEAIGKRREFAVGYDLDERSYWLVLPPEEEETDEEDEDDGGLFGGGEEEEEGKRRRPLDDVEHGMPPPDPDALENQGREDMPDLEDREALEPTKLPTGVVFDRVIVGDDESTNGRVFVPFSHLGNSGTHVVGLKLDGTDDRTIWVKFNALSRSLQYYDEQPEVKTLESRTAEAPQ